MASTGRTPERSALFDQTNGLGGASDAPHGLVAEGTQRLVAVALAGFGGLGR